MEYIIVTISVLSGVVIGYVNGRRNANEDCRLHLRELAEELVRGADAVASGKKTEHSLAWYHGALWAISQMLKDD